MEGKMKVAVMTDIQKIEFEERPIPTPKDDEVLVKLDYVGICGSDLHYYETGAIGDFVVNPPFVLGHEPGGVVVEVGKNVKHLQIGDRVALEPGKTCGHCEFCKEGKYNLCPDVIFFATPPVDGVFQEYVAHEADLCFKLPDNVSTKEGALVEPLSVGLHAANQGEVGLGDTVIILGGGCIGLVTMMACKAHGASTIIVADLVDARLDKAMELGATYTINSGKKDVFEEVKRLTGGKGADKVFETAGSPVTIAQTPFFVKRGGTIVLVGLAAQEEITYNFAQIMDKEATIKSVFRYRNVYPQAIAAISSGTIPVAKIATHEFDLDHIQEAFEEAINNKTDLVKAIIRIN